MLREKGFELSLLFKGMADIYYGYLYKMINWEQWKQGLESSRWILENTPEERARLSKIPFELYGNFFGSREEAYEVFERFGKRYKERIFENEDEIKGVLRQLIAEVRQPKNK